ncbi:MAG: hypothetical protein UZ17_ACD001001657 [Acidobacteria bacterium OLB17]|nr:MAG: hypothetical protein UZ17_ACD001001657 [Acidobacteria bacterium OLB17]MCZ2390750.1 hypothetical protein [Acidobacteriota bacterium]
MITSEKIRELRLLDRYLELLRLEVDELGVKPTELRHLIGRIGEFYCALTVDGSLAIQTNQPGFDVLSPAGRRISVKTTAQSSGFVAISKSTEGEADDLMVVRYKDGALSTIYYGPINVATANARFYQPSGNYELDLTKAEKLAQAQFEQPSASSSRGDEPAA